MKNAQQINLRIPPAQVDKLDYYADKMGLSRNQLLCNCVAISLDDLRILDTLGLLRLGAGFRDLFALARNSDDLNCIDLDMVPK